MYWVCVDCVGLVLLFGACVLWVIGWLLVLYSIVRITG